MTVSRKKLLETSETVRVRPHGGPRACSSGVHLYRVCVSQKYNIVLNSIGIASEPINDLIPDEWKVVKTISWNGFKPKYDMNSNVLVVNCKEINQI